MLLTNINSNIYNYPLLGCRGPNTDFLIVHCALKIWPLHRKDNTGFGMALSDLYIDFEWSHHW